MQVTPVARDELVYISTDPETAGQPGHRASGCREASLVMPETTWRADDSIRIMLRQMLHETGRNPQTRIEVEDVETAVELVGMGLADSVIPRGAAEQLLPRLAPGAGWVSLRPRQYDTFAIVHRAGATLSPAAQLMIELATARIQAIATHRDSPYSGWRGRRPQETVREFFQLLAQSDTTAAVALLDAEVDRGATPGCRRSRGRRVGARCCLDAETARHHRRHHHPPRRRPTATVVLTDRTDVLRKGKWETSFRVRGTFEVHDGTRSRRWDDAFSWLDLDPRRAGRARPGCL